jgi:hypothetical protein
MKTTWEITKAIGFGLLCWLDPLTATLVFLTSDVDDEE